MSLHLTSYKSSYSIIMVSVNAITILAVKVPRTKPKLLTGKSDGNDTPLGSFNIYNMAMSVQCLDTITNCIAIKFGPISLCRPDEST